MIDINVILSEQGYDRLAQELACREKKLAEEEELLVDSLRRELMAANKRSVDPLLDNSALRTQILQSKVDHREEVQSLRAELKETREALAEANAMEAALLKNLAEAVG